MVDSVNEKIAEIVLKTVLKHYPKSASMNLVRERIEEFKETIKKLSDPGISPERKKVLATEAMEVQRAIRHVKKIMPEDRFLMFYRYVIEGHTLQGLSNEYGVDVKTVRRSMRRSYEALSIQLYPDLVLGEIFTVGW